MKHVAGEALHGEVLVDRANHVPLRLQHDRVVGHVGNGAARGDGGQRGAAPAAQHAVDRVAMHMGAAPPMAGVETLGQHLRDLAELTPLQMPERISTAEAGVQIVLAPFLQGRFGDNLLRKHVEGFLGNGQAIQFAAAHAIQ